MASRLHEPDAPRDPLDQMSTQIAVLVAAMRALIQTHPQPHMLRSEFDTLIALTQTRPHYLHADTERRGHLRRLAKDLFETK